MTAMNNIDKVLQRYFDRAMRYCKFKLKFKVQPTISRDSEFFSETIHGNHKTEPDSAVAPHAASAKPVSVNESLAASACAEYFAQRGAERHSNFSGHTIALTARQC
jgi:hypothetical protein